MSNDRGKKKWLAYKSLEDQVGYINEIIYRKSRVDRPILLEARVEKLDRFLRTYEKGEVSLSYYFDGYIHRYSGVPLRVDYQRRKIVFETIVVSFDDLVDVDMEEDFDIAQ